MWKGRTGEGTGREDSTGRREYTREGEQATLAGVRLEKVGRECSARVACGKRTGEEGSVGIDGA
jgi:hypothetical protein